MGALNGHSHYAQAALDAELATLAGTARGRNHAANVAGFKMGGLTITGALDRREIEPLLLQAAEKNGSIAKHGAEVMRRTIKSGLDAGEKQPRALPESNWANGTARPKPQPATRPQGPARPATEPSGADLPNWTQPSEDGRPALLAIGKAEPATLKGETRRHAYRRAGGEAIRFKIKLEEGGFRNAYKVRRPSDGVVGWQYRKPVGYTPRPYTGPIGSGDPFDPEHVGEVVFWPEGEKDTDSLQRLGLFAFTFGGSSDTPDCHELLRGRDVVIPVDNDAAGEACVARKIEMLQGVAARIRTIRFGELETGGDVTDWLFDTGANAEALLARAEDFVAEAPAETAPGPDRFDPAGPNEAFGDPRTTSQKSEPPFEIPSRPFVWRDPKTFPRRDWIYGKHLVRKFISCTVAPGSVGKSSLCLVEAVAMCTGRPLLGISVREPLRVWVVNLEDPLEELERRITAILIHFNIGQDELGDRLHLTSGRDTKVIVASTTKAGTMIAQPVVDAFKAKIRKERIDVVVIDPLVKAHRVPENDNGAIDMVCTEFAGIADECECAFDLIHHVRKTNGAEVTVEDSRGAVALLAASRSARALNRMTQEEGERAGVVDPRFFFRADNGKANLAPPDKTAWFQLRDTPLGNGNPNLPFDNGDRVGVAEPWTWPDAMASVTVADLLTVQKAVADGKWRADVQATEWVGKAVAGVLKLNPDSKTDRGRIGEMLRTWLASGALRKVEGQDDKRKTRTFVEVGQWATK